MGIKKNKDKFLEPITGISPKRYQPQSDTSREIREFLEAACDSSIKKEAPLEINNDPGEDIFSQPFQSRQTPTFHYIV